MIVKAERKAEGKFRTQLVALKMGRSGSGADHYSCNILAAVKQETIIQVVRESFIVGLKSHS